MSAVGSGDGIQETTMRNQTQPVTSGFGLSKSILRPETDPKANMYKLRLDYIHRIVLSDLLEEELDHKQNVHNHEQLQKLANDVLPSAFTGKYTMMNTEILQELGDVDRCNGQLKHLEDILPRINELPSPTRSKLLGIAHELGRRVEVIPFKNGVAKLTGKLAANTFSQFTEDSKKITATGGTNDLIQQLNKTIQTVDGAQFQLTMRRDGLKEMNKMKLNILSHQLSKNMIINRDGL